jgi:hypothetical protein
VEYRNRSDTSKNRGNRNHPKIRKYLRNTPGKHEIKELHKKTKLGTAHTLRRVSYKCKSTKHSAWKITLQMQNSCNAILGTNTTWLYKQGQSNIQVTATKISNIKNNLWCRIWRSVISLKLCKVFALLRCYAAQIGSYRRFGTTYPSHLPGSRSLMNEHLHTQLYREWREQWLVLSDSDASQ